MRARWRAWTIRAAVIAVISAFGVIVIATPADAAAPAIEYLDVAPSVTIASGATLRVPFRIRMSNFATGNASYEVKSSDDSKLSCDVQCGAFSVPIPAVNGDQTGFAVEAKLTTHGTFDSDTRVTVTVRVFNDDGQAQQQIQVTISKTPTADSMTGKVVELLTGAPIKIAKVVVTDVGGNSWDNLATDDAGTFFVQGPIVQGDLTISVTADGYEDVIDKVFAYATWRNGVKITMSSAASSTSTTSAAPSLTASIETEGASTPIAPPEEGGLSGFSLAVIIVGGLLVLLGIGAIILLFVRKGGDNGPKGPGGRGKPGPGGRPTSPGRGPLPPGPRRPGPPDRTAPLRPGSAPPRPGGRDQTVISRSPLADNPTHGGRGGAPGRPPYGGQPPQGYPPPGPGGYPTQTHPQGGYGQPGGYPPPGGYGGQPGHPQQGGQPTYGGQPQGPDPRQPRPPRGEGRRVDWMDDY